MEYFRAQQKPASEFSPRRSLIRANPPALNLRPMIIFPSHRTARHPSQHRDLSDMRQRIRNRTLKQLLWSFMKDRIRCEIVIERFQTREKPLTLPIPSQWL